MRAYLSFLLVLLSLLLLFSLLELNLQSNSSKPLIIERTYSLSMNVKENIVESLRQGAAEGFRDYDDSHDVKLCRHCPVCSPKTCNPELCRQCFREHEARGQAKGYALSRMEQLRQHLFDPDFQVSLSDADIEIITQADPLGKNGYALHSVRIKNDILISVGSEKFNTKGTAKVPGGMVIESAGNS